MHAPLVRWGGNVRITRWSIRLYANFCWYQKHKSHQEHNPLIQMHNSHFDVNKTLCTTWWTTLYVATQQSYQLSHTSRMSRNKGQGPNQVNKQVSPTFHCVRATDQKHFLGISQVTKLVNAPSRNSLPRPSRAHCDNEVWRHTHVVRQAAHGAISALLNQLHWPTLSFKQNEERRKQTKCCTTESENGRQSSRQPSPSEASLPRRIRLWQHHQRGKRNTQLTLI